MTDQSTSPEFSRPIAVDRIGASPLVETIRAEEGERAALARRFGLEAIHHLEATVTVEPTLAGQAFAVSGRFDAQVVQTCVVTLEPFEADIGDTFETLYAEPETIPEVDAENFDPLADVPEPIENGVIDVGEVVAQYLSLSLDPHPRAPGVEADLAEETAADAAESPFAVLSQLKPR